MTWRTQFYRLSLNFKQSKERKNGALIKAAGYSRAIAAGSFGLI